MQKHRTEWQNLQQPWQEVQAASVSAKSKAKCKDEPRTEGPRTSNSEEPVSRGDRKLVRAEQESLPFVSASSALYAYERGPYHSIARLLAPAFNPIDAEGNPYCKGNRVLHELGEEGAFFIRVRLLARCSHAPPLTS